MLPVADRARTTQWSDPDFLDHLAKRNNALGVCHGETEAI